MNPFVLHGRLYELLKWVCAIVLPACGTAYLGFGDIWEWPNTDKVVASIVVIETFLGVVLGISSAVYNASGARYDGSINVVVDDGMKKAFDLELNGDPYELDQKKSVNFKVVKKVPRDNLNVEEADQDGGAV